MGAFLFLTRQDLGTTRMSVSFYTYMTVRIPDLSEITHTWKRMKLVKGMVNQITCFTIPDF